MQKILISLFLLGLLFITPSAYAQAQINICPKPSGDLNFNILCSLNPTNAFPTLLSFILIVAIIVALFYLIWGGIKWIMSGGDKGNVETARGHIIAAVIGLILVFSAWFVMNFILQTFFGGNLTAGITLPGIFTQPAPPTPTQILTPTTPSASSSAQPQSTSSLPPCPTAFPPDYECRME